MTPAPLAVSLGEPAGVGPEIIAKAWLALKGTGPAFVVVGDAASLEAWTPPGSVRRIGDAAEATALFKNFLPVLDVPLEGPIAPGAPSAAGAAFVVRWIETAARLALSGEASGLVTGPIAKAPLYEAGFSFPGHTEFLGALCAGSLQEEPRAPKGPVMMLVAGDLRVALVTIHEPLARVPGLLTGDLIVNAGLVTARALKNDFGIARPRLAVAGLNPHAGEAGALGREEIEVIAPATARLRAEGVDAAGPAPADSLFHPEARAQFDAALCMYHDQGLIPVKMVDFWGGVNVTLGLPLVRTSPDHGVAFDIAGKGLARDGSLLAALRLAGEIAHRRFSSPFEEGRPRSGGGGG